jgi:signal transduction histidine kinase
MIHQKFFWQIVSLGFVWFLVLIFGLFVNNWNLKNLTLIVSFPFLGVFIYLFFKLTKEEKTEVSATLSNFQKILDPLTEGVIIYSENKILFANQKLISLVNLDLPQIINLDLGVWLTENPKYQLLGDIIYPFVRGENVKVLSTKPETISVDFSNPERHFLITYTNIQLDKNYNMRIVIDKTREIISRREEKDLVSLITHHLRTPLNHIRWFLESLKEEKFEADEKESFRTVKNTVNQLIFVVEELVLFASIDEKVTLQPKIVSFKKLIEKIIESVKYLIENKRLIFKVSIDAAGEELAADERLLYLVLYTLIENAIIYNKDGGEVEVRLDLVKERPYSLITIKDTGIGIPEKEMKRVFEKHFRASNAKRVKGEGLGLGLYLVKKIVDWHGAEIKFESKENEGTKFTIIWPRKLELIPQEENINIIKT